MTWSQGNTSGDKFPSPFPRLTIVLAEDKVRHFPLCGLNNTYTYSATTYRTYASKFQVVQYPPTPTCIFYQTYFQKPYIKPQDGAVTKSSFPSPSIKGGQSEKTGKNFASLFAIVETPTGSPLTIVVDSGAASSTLSYRCYREHFPDAKLEPIQSHWPLQGVGGGSISSIKWRAMLTLRFKSHTGIVVDFSGYCNIADGEISTTGTKFLLGLPFLKDNGLDLKWGRNGQKDFIEVNGYKIELVTVIDAARL